MQSAEGNIHLAEERNQVTQNDKDETKLYEDDEEMKYSGVYRNEAKTPFERKTNNNK